MKRSAPIVTPDSRIVTSQIEPKDFLPFRASVIAATCLVAIVFAVYSPTLDFQFILDDHRFTGDPRIQNPDHVWDYFTSFVWAQFTGGPPSFYRPLFLLWLRINFILSGLSSWGWHLLSITKHATAAILLGVLTWKLLRDRTAALLAAALFALHPAQTESVAWVTVPDPLMSIAILAGLLFYLKYAERVDTGGPSPEGKSRRASRDKDPSAPRARWLAASVIACLAALFAKETAIVMPAVIFALAMFVRRGQPDGQGNHTGWRSQLLPALRQAAPFVCVAVLYLLMRLNALAGNLGARTQHLALKTLLLSWPATLWFYAKVMLWPAKSYAFADPTLVGGFSLRGVLLPTLGVVCVVAALAAILFWAHRKALQDLPPQSVAGVRFALVTGTLLLVLPILLVLNLNALNPGDFLHGRYTYLPSTGLMLVVATAWHVSGKMRVPLLVAGGVIAVVFAMLSLSQEKQWKDDLTVFTIAHKLAPHNAPVAENLANAKVQAALQLEDEGRCADAVPVFEQVTREFPQDWYAWAALGDCLAQLNDLPRAEQSFHRAADLSHDERVIQQWRQLRTQMGMPNSSSPN